MIPFGRYDSQPLPERPRNIDEAYDRGWDPSSLFADRYPGPPLDDVWQEAFDTSVAEARRLREESVAFDRRWRE